MVADAAVAAVDSADEVAAAATMAVSRPTSRDAPATGNAATESAATQTLPGATSATNATSPSLKVPVAETAVATAAGVAAEAVSAADEEAAAVAAALETVEAVAVGSAAAEEEAAATEAVDPCGVAVAVAETDTDPTKESHQSSSVYSTLITNYYTSSQIIDSLRFKTTNNPEETTVFKKVVPPTLPQGIHPPLDTIASSSTYARRRNDLLQCL